GEDAVRDLVHQNGKEQHAEDGQAALQRQLGLAGLGDDEKEQQQKRQVHAKLHTEDAASGDRPAFEHRALFSQTRHGAVHWSHSAMRVIAGTYRSRKLIAPSGDATRPTSDRLRETLFNVVAPGIQDSVWIDLFAGSGAVGIEALSRGARMLYFV